MITNSSMHRVTWLIVGIPGISLGAFGASGISPTIALYQMGSYEHGEEGPEFHIPQSYYGKRRGSHILLSLFDRYKLAFKLNSY